MKKKRTSAKKHSRMLRRAKVTKLRAEGKTLDQISATLGVSKGTVHNDFQASLAVTLNREKIDAERLRMDQLQRLATCTQAAFEILRDNPDPELRLKAVDRIIKVEERVSKLLGLDAPARTEFAGTVEVGAVGPMEAARLVRQQFGDHALPSGMDAGAAGETPALPAGPSDQ